MASKYQGLSSNLPPADEKDGVRALPGSWYTSQEMYELERRAIFSRHWLLTAHQNRLNETGDWLRYEIAGFDIFLVRDRKGQINGFHNVCRHRAFTVMEGQEGRARILACRYHGWSYSLDGKLAKAPGYHDLPDFDKTGNGLFPIHIHIDSNGFVWINLDAKEKPEISWSDNYMGGDNQARFAGYNFEDYEFDHTWEIDAPYNWKLAAENFNECYHCKTTHPDIPDVVDLASYSCDTQGAWIHHNGSTERQTTEEQRQKGLTVCATYYFPAVSMNVSQNFLFTQRFIPRGPQNTLVRYEVFRNKYASDEDFKLIDGMYKRVMTEDKALCAAAQNNINTGVFINGQLHPKLEKGPLFFQNLVRQAITEHHSRENEAKLAIWPAKQTLPDNATISKSDTDICSGLSCQSRPELVF